MYDEVRDHMELENFKTNDTLYGYSRSQNLFKTIDSSPETGMYESIAKLENEISVKDRMLDDLSLRLEVLEKENKELRKIVSSIHSSQHSQSQSLNPLHAHSLIASPNNSEWIKSPDMICPSENTPVSIIEQLNDRAYGRNLSNNYHLQGIYEGFERENLNLQNNVNTVNNNSNGRINKFDSLSSVGTHSIKDFGQGQMQMQSQSQQQAQLNQLNPNQPVQFKEFKEQQMTIPTNILTQNNNSQNIQNIQQNSMNMKNMQNINLNNSESFYPTSNSHSHPQHHAHSQSNLNLNLINNNNNNDVDPKTFNPTQYLEDLKTRNQNLKLEQLKDVMTEMCTHKEASRIIQEKITYGTDHEKNLIYEGIKFDVLKLANEASGNYCIQKILEEGTEHKNKVIVDSLIVDVYNTCFNSYGSKVVQRIYDALSLHYRELVSRTLLEKSIPELDKLIKDQNGNHVVQKIIEKGFSDNMQLLKNDYNNHKNEAGEVVLKLGRLLDKIRANVYELCMHPLGCRVIQKVIECIPASFLNDLVYNNIMNQIVILTEDKYGNYVIQHIVEHGDPAWKNKVVAVVRKNLLNLSNQKFSSNVVQMCLRKGSPQHKLSLIDSIIYNENSCMIIDLMKNMFGNYVIQTALEEATDEQRNKIIKYAKQNKNYLMRVRYSKHIFSKIDEMCGKKKE